MNNLFPTWNLVIAEKARLDPDGTAKPRTVLQTHVDRTKRFYGQLQDPTLETDGVRRPLL